jgi:hypothetical protein
MTELLPFKDLPTREQHSREFTQMAKDITIQFYKTNDQKISANRNEIEEFAGVNLTKKAHRELFQIMLANLYKNGASTQFLHVVQRAHPDKHVFLPERKKRARQNSDDDEPRAERTKEKQGKQLTLAAIDEGGSEDEYQLPESLDVLNEVHG